MAEDEVENGVRLSHILIVVAIAAGFVWAFSKSEKNSESQATTRTIEQVGGALTLKTGTLDPGSFQTVKEFEAADREWLARQLAQARLIIARYSHDAAPDPFDPVNLDEVFKRWLNDTAADAPKGT